MVSLQFRVKAIILFMGVLLTCQLVLFAYSCSQRSARAQHPVCQDLPCHGESKCFGDVIGSLLDNPAANWQSDRTPREQLRRFNVQMATLTADFAESEPLAQKTMQKPYIHSAARGTPLFILHAPVDGGFWNKSAFILSVLLEEMAKPPENRLKWLLWVDQVVFISECCCRPSSFLPSRRHRAAEYVRRLIQTNRTHLLATGHWNSLNNSVLLVHVDQWNIDLFGDIVALRRHKPERKHPFTELSVMGELLKTDKYRSGIQYIPHTLLWSEAWGGKLEARRSEHRHNMG